MTKPTKVPIHKRFPGHTAVRMHIWSPDGRVMLEGAFTKEAVAKAFTALLDGQALPSKRKP